jgi:hypothetical protein
MNSIKFSHRYTKLPATIKSGDEVTLLEVLNSRFQDLHPAFIRYDATTCKGELYPLPAKGACLVLIFQSTRYKPYNNSLNDEIFTTVRRHTPEKEKYYKGLRGEVMRLEMIVFMSKNILPVIYYCKNSYGTDNIMTECLHGFDTTKCSRHCEKFASRDITKNEDERMLQSLEWE